MNGIWRDTVLTNGAALLSAPLANQPLDLGQLIFPHRLSRVISRVLHQAARAEVLCQLASRMVSPAFGQVLARGLEKEETT